MIVIVASQQYVGSGGIDKDDGWFGWCNALALLPGYFCCGDITDDIGGSDTILVSVVYDFWWQIATEIDENAGKNIDEDDDGNEVD